MLVVNKPLFLLDHFTEMIDEERLDERVPYGDWRALKKFFVHQSDGKQRRISINKTAEAFIMVPDDGLTFHSIPIDHPFGIYLDLLFEGVTEIWEEAEAYFIPETEANIKGNRVIGNNESVSAVEYNPKVVIEGDLIVKGKIINENIDKDREDKNMKFNFDFGSCEKDNVKMSPYGIAIKNSDSTWVSYDAKTGNIIDVDVFNFDGGKYLFKMPVAVKDIKVGDTIVHQRVPVYVVSIDKGDITVVDPRAGDKKTILPTQSPFGFSFVTKIISLLDSAFGATPSNDSPFGNMLPFFLMSNNDGEDIDPLMMAMLLGSNAGASTQNPMMMALLCSGQSNMREILPLMMLAGQLNPLPNGGAQ